MQYAVPREEVFPRMPGLLASGLLTRLVCISDVCRIHRSTCLKEEHDVTEDGWCWLRSLDH